MKKLSIIFSVLLSSILGSQAFAQASNFEGFEVHGGIGYQSTTASLTNLTKAGVSQNQPFSSNAASAAVLNLGLGYTAALNNNFTIGGVFEYNPVKDKTGNLDPIGQPANSGATTKLQNQMSIAIVPGYAFTNDTLAFAKLGYSASTQTFANEDGTAGSPGNTNLHGMLLGIGAKQNIMSNVFGYGEINYFKNSDAGVTGTGNIAATSQTHGYNLVFGAGYKF